MTTAARHRMITDVSGFAAPLEPATVPGALATLLPAGFGLEPAGHGHSSAVAFVCGAGEALVLKRAAAAPYVGWLVTEAEVLRALADTTLPVPRVRGLVHDEREAWLLVTRLSGEPLVDVLPRVPAADRSRWFHQIGGLLASIHVTPVPPALCARDATPWRPRPRPVGSGREALRATHLDDPSVGSPRVLVHGDFTLDNVLADEHGPTGVVDWGGAGLGDPRYDVALALLSANEGATGAPPGAVARPPHALPTAACVRAFYDGYLAVAGHDASLSACFAALRDP